MIALWSVPCSDRPRNKDMGRDEWVIFWDQELSTSPPAAEERASPCLARFSASCVGVLVPFEHAASLCLPARPIQCPEFKALVIPALQVWFCLELLDGADDLVGKVLHIQSLLPVSGGCEVQGLGFWFGGNVAPRTPNGVPLSGPSSR